MSNTSNNEEKPTDEPSEVVQQRLVSHLYHCWRLYRLAKMMKKSIKLDQKIDNLADNLEKWETKNVNL